MLQRRLNKVRKSERTLCAQIDAISINCGNYCVHRTCENESVTDRDEPIIK